MPPLASTLPWLLGQLAWVALAALLLRISIAAVGTARRGASARNDYPRALLVCAGLTLASHAIERVNPGALLGGACMLAIWLLTVRWAYRLDLAQTVLVALLMLCLTLGATVILARVLGAMPL